VLGTCESGEQDERKSEREKKARLSTQSTKAFQNSLTKKDSQLLTSSTVEKTKLDLFQYARFVVVHSIKKEIVLAVLRTISPDKSSKSVKVVWVERSLANFDPTKLYIASATNRETWQIILKRILHSGKTSSS
jgi:hypothetical protein